MAWSEYMAGIRDKIGNDLLLVPAAGIALFDDAGRVLLARHRHDGQWGTPGGGMEPGESPEEAARRECLEETGLTVRETELVGAFGGPAFEVTYPGGARTAYVVTLFGAVAADGEIGLQADELTEHAWFGPDEIDQQTLQPDMQIMLPAAFAWYDRSGLR